MSVLLFAKLCNVGNGGLRAGVALACVLAPPAMAQSGSIDDDSPPTISQAVVQPIPSRDSMTLNDALVRLGRDPRDVGALIDAGNAALMLGDIDAATGFFRRADQLAAGNPRVKAGLAGAMVRNGNPFDAIPLFQDAERAGAIDSVLAGDRGLAYDLVGDNEAAQRFYRMALARGPNEEVTRRLALSLAIAGDRRGAEIALSPQLQAQNKAAWRARAFALAILGQPEDAVSITRTILPEELATAIAPYLRYMPRLTPAQQAAAANFGAFPRASEIGRDDPRVALFAPPGKRPLLAAADAGLVPRGEPLGSRTRPDRSKRSDRRDDSRVAAVQPPRIAPGEVQPAIVASERPTQVAVAATRLQPAPVAPAPVVKAQPNPAAAQPLYVPPPAAVTPTLAPPAAPLYVPPPAAAAQPAPAAVIAKATLPAFTVAETVAPGPSAVIVPASSNLPQPVSATPAAVVPASAPVAVAANPAPGFDLARLPASATSAPQTPAATVPPTAAPPAQVASAALSSLPATASGPSSMSGPVVPSEATLPTALAKDPFGAPVATAAAPPPAAAVPASVTATTAQPVVAAPPASPSPALAAAPARVTLTDAFADISRPVVDTTPAAGAVDVRRIRPARPKPPVTDEDVKDKKGEKTEKRPAPPSHPSRIWVQVATGRDKTALAYDWRRMSRDASDAFKGRSAYSSTWGQTNRLLAGPFGSEAAANGFMSQLRRAEITGTFIWTSPAGQVVDTLGSR